MADVVEQQLDYPDGNYEGGLTVDDKEPELKWAVAGRSAVPELFNWLGRKTTEDIQKVRDYLSEFESIRKLTPMGELVPIAGKEPDIIYTNNYRMTYAFSDSEENEVGGTVNLIRTEPKIVINWSMPVVSTSTEPEISINIDIAGEGDVVGNEIISSTKTLSVPNQPDSLRTAVFDLGDVSEGDEDEDGWDDVRGKGISIYVSRSPDSSANGLWHMHSIEVA